MKRILRLCLYISVFFCAASITSCHTSKTQVKDETSAPAKISKPEITLPEVNDWTKCSISGKFKMKGLPVSPGVKIFMEKDASIYVSLKVPLMGEVGRMEIKGDMILVVNKINKTYVEENIRDSMRYYPGSLQDLQDLLLARMVIPGYGTLTPKNQNIVNISPNGESYYIMPKEKVKIKGFEYGYVIDNSLKPTLLMINPENDPDASFLVNYDYNRSGYDIGISVVENGKKTECSLDLDNPEWKGTPPSPVKLDGKYTKVTPQKFINSMGKL